MADTPVLVVKEGAARGEVLAVREGGMGIGRSPDNDVVIDHVDASRFHARLLYDNGSLWIRDVGSRNGVFVNGDRLADHRALKVGDVVRIADTSFEVRWESTVEDEPSDDGGSSGPGPTSTGSWWWPFGSTTTE